MGELFKLELPEFDVPVADYQELLNVCDPEALCEMRGSIFPEAPFDVVVRPRKTTDLDKLLTS